jgi:YD repeat-containing protein
MVQPVAYAAALQTAHSSVFGPGPFILHNDGQNQMAPSPHLAEVQGNNGQLSYSYPLQVAPGSGGVAPHLKLDYSSMGPNDRHSITSPVSDEGDGFSLSMGSISSQVSPNSGVTWYFINGIGNVSDRLIEYDTTNQSEPFVVAVSSSTHGSGYIDPTNAKDSLNTTVYGTGTYFDALGRVLAVRDPLYNASLTTGIACSTLLSGNYAACTNYSVGQVSGDSNSYISATSVDPNNHVSVSYLDALGRAVYSQQDSNLSGGMPAPTPNEQTTLVYNALDTPISVKVTDLATQTGQTITSATTTMQYDDLGRLTQLADPDRGTHTYTYDANGNVIEDDSGSSPTRIIGDAYDLLNRLGCVQD